MTVQDTVHPWTYLVIIIMVFPLMTTLRDEKNKYYIAVLIQTAGLDMASEEYSEPPHLQNLAGPALNKLLWETKRNPWV